MPASTIITSRKNSTRSKDFTSVARPCAACSARKVSVRPANAAHRLIASAACASLAKANSCNSTALLTIGWKAAARLTVLGMQDDATGKILAAQFFLAETTEGYFHLLQSLLRRFGVPTAFYGDRSGIFVRHDDHWTLEEELAGQRQPTQFGRTLAELGITFIAAQSPQAKGRVERLWGVLQDRLCSELRLAGACDLDSANRVLRRFIADYNRRFARTPRETSTAWRPAPEDLTRVCAFRHDRVVSNDNVVQWEGRRLQIPPQHRRCSFAGATVQLYQALDGRVSLYYGDTRLEHTNASGG